MLNNMLLGLGTMLICLTLQIVLILLVIRYYRKNTSHIDDPTFLFSLWIMGGIMILLVIGNLSQIAIWGGLFLHLGEFDMFSMAFYHSAVNFAALGYGDVVMSEKHQLLGPLESVNGILMIGVSSSALMSAFQHIMGKAVKSGKHVP